MNLWNPIAGAELLSSEFSVRLTQMLLHFLWQGLAVGLLVWIVDRLSRRTSSQVRYAVSVAALFVMLASMPVTYAVLGRFPGRATETTADLAVASRSAVDPSTSSEAPLAANPAAAQVASASSVGDVDPISATGAHNRPILKSLPAQLAPYATLTYLLGVLFMLARLGLALREGQRLRQSAAMLSDPAILAMAARQARRIGLRAVPTVAWCQRAAVPLVVGLVKPAILLPTAIASGLAPDQMEALLAHELAHLKRLDLIVNLVQRLAESLLFFHPAVWYVSRRISVERENCCDDCVVAAGWGRVEYADALVRMAEICAAARGLTGLEGAALLAASGEGPSQFKRRVLRLLDPQDHLRMGISRGWLLAAAGAILLGLAAIPFAVSSKSQAASAHAEKEQPPAADAPPEQALSDRQPSLEDASRTLQAALLDRQEYLTATFPNDEQLIKSELFVAEQQVKTAQTALDHAKRLAAKGLITQLQLEATDFALKKAQIDVNAAQARLDVLRKFTKEKMVAELDRKVVHAARALLDEHVALKVSERPLIFVLDDLEKAYQIPVTIDLKEVQARGRSAQTRVTIDLTDKSLREVFMAVLSSAGLDFEVTAQGIQVPAKVKRDGGAPREVKLKDSEKKVGAVEEQAQAWGDLTVQLVYDGPKPGPKTLPVVNDVATFGAAVRDESLLVGEKGGLANVAVYLTSADAPIHPDTRGKADRPAELKVTAEGTRPRILPLMVPQKLKLINDTNVGVNIMWQGLANSSFNFLVPKEETREFTLNKGERAPSPVTDGIHPWLIAYLLPLNHPYAAVSDADGVARLANLPDGEWTFRFWHEKAGYLKSAETGQREFKIKIKPGESRLKLNVAPEFTVKAIDASGDKPTSDGATKLVESKPPSPEPDRSVSRSLQGAGVSLRIDPQGRVTEIYLGASANDEMLQQIGRLPNLKKLHIELARQLTSKGFEHLAALPALESLGLYDVLLPEGTLATLARIRSLKELLVVECGMMDADIAPLAICTRLTSLSLRGNAITDNGLDSIVKLKNLEVLDLGNSSSVGSQMQITDRGLAKLAALTRLKHLNLSSTRLPLGFTDKGLSHLSEFPDLESFDVSGFGLSDEALVHMGRCTNLRRLGLHHGGFSDKGMKEIRKLTKLKSISIASGQLTEAGLLHLEALPQLEFAELRTSGVTDRVMERLAQIKSLARLDLYSSAQPGVAVSLPPFTAKGMAHFKDHPGLRTLWLTNLEIDASMLAALKEMTQLGELTLIMPSLSDDDVRELQAALPKTRVSAAWGGHGIAPIQDQRPSARTAGRTEGNEILFADNFGSGLSDKWQIVGLDKMDYRQEAVGSDGADETVRAAILRT
jgi:beta-lactamase regulating signal transducer with metallopeptidase domain